MTKSDLLRRLENLSDDKVFIIKFPDGGWCNLGEFEEKECVIELSLDYTRPFTSDN